VFSICAVKDGLMEIVLNLNSLLITMCVTSITVLCDLMLTLDY
jgi:hypothetical protein